MLDNLKVLQYQFQANGLFINPFRINYNFHVMSFFVCLKYCFFLQLARANSLEDWAFSFTSWGLTTECSDITNIAAGGLGGAALRRFQYLSYKNNWNRLKWLWNNAMCLRMNSCSLQEFVAFGKSLENGIIFN